MGTVAHSAADEARATADTAKREVAGLARSAQAEFHKQSDEQTRRLADRVRDVSSQLDGIARGDAPRDGVVADLVRQAADKTGQFAQRLDEGGIDRVTADVKQFARQRPGVFLTCAFGLGVVAGRTLRNADTQALVQAAKPGEATATTPSLATPQ
jgi:hypothetical protein